MSANESRGTVTIVLTCEGEKDIEWNVSVETYSRLLRAWSALEVQLGECLDFDAFLTVAFTRTIAQAQRHARKS